MSQKRVWFLSLIVVFAMLATSSGVLAKPLPPEGLAQPSTQHPIMVSRSRPEYQRFQAGAAAQTSAESSTVNAQAIALGKPGTTYSLTDTFGFMKEAYPEDDTHLNGPSNLAVDASGNLYVMEDRGARVLSYNLGTSPAALNWKAGQAGMHDWSLAGFNYPHDIALDETNHILWIADNDVLTRLDFTDTNNLAFTHFPEEPWNNPDENFNFRGLQSVALDSAGRIYVADQNRNVVRVFTYGSGSLTWVGNIGVPDEQGDSTQFERLNQPVALAIDKATNHVYISDRMNWRVLECEPSEPFATWTCSAFDGDSTNGGDDDQLGWVMGLGIDTSNLYIADSSNGRIKKLPLTGAAGSPNYITNLWWPTDVAIKSNDHLLVSEYDNFVVWDYDPANLASHTLVVGVVGIPYITDTSHINGPRGIDIDSSGAMYVLEEEGQRLLKFKKDGSWVWTIGQPGIVGNWQPSNPTNLLSYPRAVAVDNHGKVFVGSGADLRSYNSATGVFIANLDRGYYWDDSNTADKNYRFDWITGLAVDTAGNLYVTDGNLQRVMVYNKAGLFLKQLGTTNERGQARDHFNNPMGLAVDSARNLYVADGDNCRVQKFDKTFLYKQTFSTGMCGNSLDRMGKAADVAVDSLGNVFVTDEWNPRVQVYDKNGAYLTTLGGNYGDNLGSFRNAFGVALDKSGAVYVAVAGNQVVQKFTKGVPYFAQLNLNGFGSMKNNAIYAVTSFKGQIYAGTNIQDGPGAQIWRQGKNGWEKVIPDGFEDGSNRAIDSLIEYQGFLYASTDNCPGPDCSGSKGGQLWRSQDGLTWHPVTYDAFGSKHIQLFHLGLLGGKLCVSTWPNSDTEPDRVYCSQTGDPDTWTEEFRGDDGSGSVVTSMLDYNGRQYLSGMASSASALWSRVGAGGWSEVDITTLTIGTPSVAITNLVTYNSKLYAATRSSPVAGSTIWRCALCDGTDWEKVSPSDGFGDPNSFRSMVAVVGKNLYAVLGNSDTGIQVWQAKTVPVTVTNPTGLVWSQMTGNGMGSANNWAMYWSNSVLATKTNLYIGGVNYANGAQLWKMCPTAKACK